MAYNKIYLGNKEVTYCEDSIMSPHIATPNLITSRNQITESNGFLIGQWSCNPDKIKTGNKVRVYIRGTLGEGKEKFVTYSSTASGTAAGIIGGQSMTQLDDNLYYIEGVINEVDKDNLIKTFAFPIDSGEMSTIEEIYVTLADEDLGYNLITNPDQKYENLDYLIGRYNLDLNHQFIDGEIYTITIYGKLGTYENGAPNNYFSVYNSGGIIALVAPTQEVAENVHRATFIWRNTIGSASVTPTYLHIFNVPNKDDDNKNLPLFTPTRIDHVVLTKGVPYNKTYIGDQDLSQNYTENLLVGTNDLSIWHHPPSYTVQMKDQWFEGKYAVVCSPGTEGQYAHIGIYITSLIIGTFTNNAVITLSADVWLENKATVNFGQDDQHKTMSCPAGQWVRVHRSFVLNNAKPLTLYCFTAGKFALANIKLEYGNNPDPVWTPNSKDKLNLIKESVLKTSAKPSDQNYSYITYSFYNDNIGGIITKGDKFTVTVKDIEFLAGSDTICSVGIYDLVNKQWITNIATIDLSKKTVTFTANSELPNEGEAFLLLYAGRVGQTQNKQIRAHNLMLTKGIQPYTWTPAPTEEW